MSNSARLCGNFCMPTLFVSSAATPESGANAGGFDVNLGAGLVLMGGGWDIGASAVETLASQLETFRLR